MALIGWASVFKTPPPSFQPLTIICPSEGHLKRMTLTLLLPCTAVQSEVVFSHLFITFYYSLLSCPTSPVCVPVSDRKHKWHLLADWGSCPRLWPCPVVVVPVFHIKGWSVFLTRLECLSVSVGISEVKPYRPAACRNRLRPALDWDAL